MKIAICCSAAFYEKANEIKLDLKKLRHTAIVPFTARKMEKNENYKVSDYKVWYRDPKFYYKKANLMKRHFREINKADAILVVNLEKKGIKNYIGANTLLEMGLAFYLGKKIYLLNPVPNVSYKEEILGMNPTVIKGVLSKIV